MFDLKRIITDVLAYVLGIAGAAYTALEGIPDGSEWYVVLIAIVIAVVSWFNGRNADGSKKAVPSKV